jgi:hypothetical protein
MFRQRHVINEKTKIIPIKGGDIFSLEKEDSSPKGEYSLKSNFFDPTKSSPPNEFMIKLSSRLVKYESFATFYEDIKQRNFESE